MTGDRICICGKDIAEDRFFCSDRCRWIAEKMNTPLGQNMTIKRAVRFFGKQYDKKHGGK